jgi:hypothetical protein
VTPELAALCDLARKRGVILTLVEREALVAALEAADRERGAAIRQRDEARDHDRIACDALQRKGYREECDIPACNCGAQWNHGGHAPTRLAEIHDALGMLTQGRTALDAVKLLVAEREAETELWGRIVALVGPISGSAESTIALRMKQLDEAGAALVRLDAAIAEQNRVIGTSPFLLDEWTAITDAVRASRARQASRAKENTVSDSNT